MNYPGNPSGNWTWRMAEPALDESLLTAIQELNFLFSREKLSPETQEGEPG
jgi:4-alpha-glucanotransferase